MSVLFYRHLWALCSHYGQPLPADIIAIVFFSTGHAELQQRSWTDDEWKVLYHRRMVLSEMQRLRPRSTAAARAAASEGSFSERRRLKTGSHPRAIKDKVTEAIIGSLLATFYHILPGNWCKCIRCEVILHARDASTSLWHPFTQ